MERIERTIHEYANEEVKEWEAIDGTKFPSHSRFYPIHTPIQIIHNIEKEGSVRFE